MSSVDDSHECLKDNTVIIVLGASGDLAKKKTLPALYLLFHGDFLPKDTKIVGYARTKMDDEEFQKRATSNIKKADNSETTTIEAFKKTLSYVSGSYDDAQSFKTLNTHIESLEKNYKTKEYHRIFYLALNPVDFIPVSKHLKENCYVTTGGINRIIVETPFGKDLESAQQLVSSMQQYWSEHETFRIDNYLGKLMIKNLFVLRFANSPFGNCWDKNSIAGVEITFKEPFGTEGRGGYFDEFGIIRDVIQSHLLQALTIIAMESPASFKAEDIRDEKVNVLAAITPIGKDEILFAQYVAANGKPGYLDDDTVPRDSICPTYAACVAWVNTPRWDGVPFILKAGKALDEAKVEIRIQFKGVTEGVFTETTPSELVIRIKPSQAVYMIVNAKTPGVHNSAGPMKMNLAIAEEKILEPYASLILDALRGDHSNFIRNDELNFAWEIFTPVLHWIERSKDARSKLASYPYGSEGPKDFDQFIQRYGYKRLQEAN